MAQDIFPDINPSTTSGTQLATLLNDFKEAEMTSRSGSARPSEILPGGLWLDTTQEGTPDFLWVLKMYDGVTDRTLLTLNLATGGVIIAGSEDVFNIMHISADAVGPILKLTKRRVASSGQVLIGDSLGEAQFIGRGNDSSNPVAALLKAVALNNMTASASGAALVFEITTTGSTSRIEAARLIDGKFGVGTAVPTHTIHALGTGIKTEYNADDAVGAKIIMRKKRITGGQTLSADQIASVEARSTDNAGTPAECTTATIEAEATQAHTTGAQGTKWIVKVIKNGATALSSIMEIGEEIKSLVLHSFDLLKLNSQDIATAASINQLNADKALVRFINSTQTDLRGINSAAGKTKVITLHNASSASVICKHANGTATAADRFDLPQGRDITIKAGSSAEFFYDETATRWKVKSGAGGGGGEVIIGGTRAAPTAITAGGGITASLVDLDTQQFIEGSSGHVEVTANPQISAGFQVGQKLKLRSRNEAQTVTLNTGTGLVLKGPWVGGEDATLALDWDGTNWVENYRTEGMV